MVIENKRFIIASKIAFLFVFTNAAKSLKENIVEHSRHKVLEPQRESKITFSLVLEFENPNWDPSLVNITKEPSTNRVKSFFNHMMTLDNSQFSNSFLLTHGSAHICPHSHCLAKKIFCQYITFRDVDAVVTCLFK